MAYKNKNGDKKLKGRYNKIYIQCKTKKCSRYHYIIIPLIPNISVIENILLETVLNSIELIE